MLVKHCLCSQGLARALAPLHKDTCMGSSCPWGPWVLHTLGVGDTRALCSLQQLNTMCRSRAERNPPLMLFWKKSPESHHQGVPFLPSPLLPLQGGRGPSAALRTCEKPNHGELKPPCHPLFPPHPSQADARTQQQRLHSPKPCAAETPTRLPVTSSSQECFEVAQTRGESMSKRDGERDKKVPPTLSRSSGEQRIPLQVSARPGVPGALSTSPDGTQWAWYGPAMGAAFPAHSFTPPWLERFLSSLWFPSQC